MKAGIVGLPQVGKTAIFKILTRSSDEVVRDRGHRSQPNVGMVRVPDSRVDFLASVFSPRKVTYATIEFVDVGGLVRGKGRDMALDPVRDVDVLVHVVRLFDDPQVPHPEGSIDPQRDIRNLDTELMLADLQSIEKRLERLDKDRKKVKDTALERERDLLGQSKDWLESEKPLRAMTMDSEDRRRVRGFAFLSEKPILHVWNVGEDQLDLLGEGSPPPRTAQVSVCGKLEAEMSQLEPDELQSFLDDYGMAESGMVRLIRSTYDLLGLISFLTAGEEECRAWTIRKGTRAQQAAGAIHTDLEKHFIRAEVAAFEDFREHPTFAALRERGLLRLEGKDYEVRDGDILTIRHSG
jgi:GTP-binding protein YchF